MPKEEWGTKRLCPTTGKRFYDLNKTPIVSPYTGDVVNLDTGKSRVAIAEKVEKKVEKKAEVVDDADEVLEVEDDDVDIEDDILEDDDDDDNVSLDEIADVATNDDET